MTNAFNPFLRVVSDMMRKFGGNGTLEVFTGTSSYDPETSTMVVAKRSYTIRAMMFDYVPRKDGQNLENGSLVRSGDKQLFIKPDTTHPAPKVGTDMIVFGGKRYGIVAIKELNTSGGTTVYYELYIRE